MHAAGMEQSVQEIMDYVVGPHFRIRQEVADKIGPELLALRDLSDAEVVTRVYQTPSMALHDEILWHDYSAAELYRQQQVAYYRRGLTAVKHGTGGAVIESIPLNRVKPRVLVSAEEVEAWGARESRGLVRAIPSPLSAAPGPPAPTAPVASPPTESEAGKKPPAVPLVEYAVDVTEPPEGLAGVGAVMLRAAEAELLDFRERYTASRGVLIALDRRMEPLFASLDEIAAGEAGG